MVVLILDQQFLIDLSSFLKVTSQKVEGSHAKLIFERVRQSSVMSHDFVLISDFLRKLEQKSVF
jgi:hypothetical protein